jgi:hypothetical protein
VCADCLRKRHGPVCAIDGKLYLWKRIHWPTVDMASWVSLSDESFALRLSSVKAILYLHLIAATTEGASHATSLTINS